MANPKPNPEPQKSLHPAYSVTNIQTKIRTLNGIDGSYSSWRKLFKLLAKADKVFDHIDGSPPPEATSDKFTEWLEIDSLVLQWIYSTISNKLLVRIIENDITAHDTWTKLEAIFLNNQRAYVAALRHNKFANVILASQRRRSNSPSG
ncbi:uncharacterized protein LOC143627735 [Bidens hawaiensis]|uniref:uncharacterized protein LOC143627735 n=1 Tax=Bidens hawaiensis TaxID=980011 RepID=UPI00404AC9CA